jgi:hypothetical protein
MPRFMVEHRHEPCECGVAYAAFKGHASPLRKSRTVSSCATGRHAIWWLVDAPSPQDALDLLPAYVAQRSTAVEVRKVVIP